MYERGKDVMIELMHELERNGYPGAREDSYQYMDEAADYEVRIPLKNRDEQEIRRVFAIVERGFKPQHGFHISTGFRVPGMDIEQAVENHYLILENKKVARKGGAIAGNARKELEERLGNSVISPLNANGLENKDIKQIESE